VAFFLRNTPKRSFSIVNKQPMSRRFGATLTIPTKAYDPEQLPPQKIYREFAELYKTVEKGSDFKESAAASEELEILSSQWFGDREFFYSERMSVWPYQLPEG